MPAKKTAKSAKAVKQVLVKRVAKPARKNTGTAKKPAKKALVKHSTPKKPTSTGKKSNEKKMAPKKPSAAVTKTVNKAAAEERPKVAATKQRAAPVQKPTHTKPKSTGSARPQQDTAKAATLTTIGLIGAGHIGSQLARLAVANGYNVVISNSRGPDTLASLVAELGPKARAATAAEAAQAGDLVVVTVPLKNYRQVPVEPLAGKTVIDTNNYYPQRDGHIAELDNESTTTSELLQAHLPSSKVVKAFNHIYAADLTTLRTTGGHRKSPGLGDCRR